LFIYFRKFTSLGGAADDRLENSKAIDTSESRFRGALRMRHQAKNIPFRIADSGNILTSPIRIAGVGDRSLFATITEKNLLILSERFQSGGIGKIRALPVSDRKIENGLRFIFLGETSFGVFNANQLLMAAELQIFISNQSPRKKSRLTKHLKAVANTNHNLPFIGRLNDRLHDWGELRNRPTAEIIPIGKPTGKNDAVGILQIGIFMPDIIGLLLQNLLKKIETVLIAV